MEGRISSCKDTWYKKQVSVPKCAPAFKRKDLIPAFKKADIQDSESQVERVA